jgi:hypothetical protein
MKWMKKEEFMNRRKRWERGENDMKHRKASISWQNDTVELSKTEQVVISCLRTGYTRATHNHIIEKTDIPDSHSAMYEVRIILYGSAVKHVTKGGLAIVAMRHWSQRPLQSPI